MNVDYAAIAAAVRGRRLSEADIHMLATESACPLAEVKHCLQDLVKQQAGIWLPAVARERRGWVCNRCGGRECQEWPSARGWAATCLRCRSMGAVTSLQLIYQDQRALCRNDQPVRFCPEFLLTEAQECAAQEVLSFVQGNEARALLWAACGAGKTEVCFPALAWALERGYSVLIAAPRRDVIDDIAPRLRHDFPDVPMQVLTGSSTERFASGVVVVVATTHQVLRFARVFDWVILDEVDAFPYRDNEMLRWGLENALVEGGKLLCLTATPAVEQFRQMKKGLLAQIRL
ncbi:MAG: DEAD/DEAH box helicase family protein, partial [Peptococcaceae bacterium]|nr:DEAD/DEAH box helicase family protein [Peptococcaceae bacterium]